MARTCLVYEIYPTEKPMTLICPFNFIKGQMLQGKLKCRLVRRRRWPQRRRRQL